MNIYVSKLDRQTTEAEIRDLFKEHGAVNSVKIITDFETGQSRGFAFIDMPNNEEGQKAIDTLAGAMLNNQAIDVQVAREKTEKPKRSSFSGQNDFRR